ncbi:sulfotransferase family protein [Muriicola sp. Z0-33]|uniref:sulfotransferase family protein n=1 Tax=Muriicola sp. Z0-33 TaxID=2816957 RepID=UPI0022371CBD|nr:sulfotransferase family protein [Muriicola sp. Z0-33]MCW5515598.1 sulfotransferase family 2 domain-containing protein [Muriicola sp. Z0-33]
MIISHGKKFIFIHNYKVAGTSMRQALKSHNDQSFLKCSLDSKFKFLLGSYPKIYSSQFDGHSTALEIKNKIPAEVFDSYYKFGFVRNPWDWQVSLYTYMLKSPNHYQHELITSLGSFEKYLDWRIHNELRLQKRFFYDEQNNCLVDFIGKMEQLNEDLDTIGRKLGITIDLPHLKKSRKNNSFSQHYTERTIDLVNEAFAEDIKTFGYTKPSL